MFRLFKKEPKKKEVNQTPDNIFHTDSGMLGLWDYSTYQHIDDYEIWEPEFVEDVDIIRNIKNATYVPININSDGAYSVEIKFNELCALSERENRYLIVTSQPYLLKTNGKIALSGMETVGREPVNNIKIFDVEPGEYIVRIHLIAWDEEPGSKDADGKPTENALPDFTVFISSHDGTNQSFRQSVETFRQQDAR